MVKVLVATTEAQGIRTGDYAHAVDGELVYVPVSGCQRSDGGDPATWCDPTGEGGCGCWRGFAGMASTRSTTTAMVVERFDLTGEDVWMALSDSLERQGHIGSPWTTEEADLFRHLFQRMLATASHFPTGSIIERQGERIRRRTMAEPLPVPSDVGGVES
jgi:hypothetical protein